MLLLDLPAGLDVRSQRVKEARLDFERVSGNCVVLIPGLKRESGGHQLCLVSLG